MGLLTSCNFLFGISDDTLEPNDTVAEATLLTPETFITARALTLLT